MHTSNHDYDLCYPGLCVSGPLVEMNSIMDIALPLPAPLQPTLDGYRGSGLAQPP